LLHCSIRGKKSASPPATARRSPIISFSRFPFKSETEDVTEQDPGTAAETFAFPPLEGEKGALLAFEAIANAQQLGKRDMDATSVARKR
jgi:hypothetical protein